MATVSEQLLIGPRQNGTLMTPEEFDHADFEEGWRYELVNGVLIVSPRPLEEERDPNEEFGHWLRLYQETHPQGRALDKTLHEHIVRTRRGRRAADRAIWAGLGRKPRRGETPTIIAEFVSEGKKAWKRDYEEKRDEYAEIGVVEYWVIDRFERTLTVYFLTRAGKARKRTIREGQVYATKLLPGFELRLSELLALADEWGES